MDASSVEALLEAVARGEVSAREAADRLGRLPIADLGFAQVDTHRELRTGLPEVIYCPGKTPDQISAIARELLTHPGGPILATRADPAAWEAVRDVAASWDPVGRIIVVRAGTEDAPAGHVVVVTAGTADLPVAREAICTLQALGIKATEVNDVGVAGLHRTLAAQDTLRAADVLIVCAGMEGALASVVGGLVSTPVIAVPTSVGYGASFGGLAALLAMLNSCALGVGVVNIDNGFGAAVLAARILRGRA